MIDNLTYGLDQVVHFYLFFYSFIHSFILVFMDVDVIFSLVFCAWVAVFRLYICSFWMHLFIWLRSIGVFRPNSSRNFLRGTVH